jgi:hypothetical protein
MSTAATPNPHKPVDAWLCAREILGYMIDLFGQPAEIAAKLHIGPLQRRLMREWLRNLERLVRRLLLVAALSLDLAAARVRPGGASARVQPIVTPDNAAGWIASLRLFGRGRGAGPSGLKPGARRATAGEDKRPIDAWPFALRLEALRRILDAPEQRIRLAASKLARLRAANAGAASPRAFQLKPWLIPRARRTPAEDAIYPAMTFIEPLAEDALDRWHEPG